MSYFIVLLYFFTKRMENSASKQIQNFASDIDYRYPVFYIRKSKTSGSNGGLLNSFLKLEMLYSSTLSCQFIRFLDLSLSLVPLG